MASSNREEVRDFLVSRRGKVRPDQVELPTGGNRRVPGLRRGEVAALAGVSVEYYSRLERGNLAGVSESVLDAIASALRLDDAERDHLFHLARTANPAAVRRPRRNTRQVVVRPGLQLALDAITGGPALIRNDRMDIIATNALGRALHAAAYAHPRRPVNLARHCFLDRASAEQFYPDWDGAADAIVAILRAEAGRDPHDKDLQDLVGELSTLSADFRAKWGAHDVRRHATGEKHFNHPVVGTLDLLFRVRRADQRTGLEAAHLHRRTRHTGCRCSGSARQLGCHREPSDHEPGPRTGLNSGRRERQLSVFDQLSGASRLFPIIGDPVRYVESPVWLTRTLGQRGVHALCVPMQTPDGALDVVMAGLAATPNVDGILVTMPHKHTAYAHCTTATERAMLLEVVSVIRRNPDGSWHGDMLDGLAFVKAQRDHGAEIEDARALLIGAGGAGSAIAITLLQDGVSQLVIHDADDSRAAALVKLLADERATAGGADPTDCDLVFNATPMGMEETDPLPVDPTLLTSSMFVGDVISGHGTTSLIAAAQAAGCRTAGGGDMVEAVQDLMADFMMGR